MTELTGIFAAREPLGTFHAVSCQDPSSIERDGQKYYGYNELRTSTGRPKGEIQFVDGIWLLCNPDLDLAPSSDP